MLHDLSFSPSKRTVNNSVGRLDEGPVGPGDTFHSVAEKAELTFVKDAA